MEWLLYALRIVKQKSWTKSRQGSQTDAQMVVGPLVSSGQL